MTPAYLFVYGTLKRASRHPRAQWLATRSRWLGVATTPGRLYDLGRYPGMIEYEGGQEVVHGDLFELPEPDPILAEIDRYEGCNLVPPLFERCQRQVTLEGGRKVMAWLYLFRGSVEGARRLDSGAFAPSEGPKEGILESPPSS